jgi:hypothetical protein
VPSTFPLIVAAAAVWTGVVLLVRVARPRTSVMAVYEPAGGGDLELVDVGDGVTETILLRGSPVISIRADDQWRNYIYFRVARPPAARQLSRLPSITFIVEYLSPLRRSGVKKDQDVDGELPFWIGYSKSRDVPYKRALAHGIIGQPPWKLAFFPAPSCLFQQLQAGRADFRVNPRSDDIPLIVRTVWVVGMAK